MTNVSGIKDSQKTYTIKLGVAWNNDVDNNTSFGGGFEVGSGRGWRIQDNSPYTIGYRNTIKLAGLGVLDKSDSVFSLDDQCSSAHAKCHSSTMQLGGESAFEVVRSPKKGFQLRLSLGSGIYWKQISVSREVYNKRWHDSVSQDVTFDDALVLAPAVFEAAAGIGYFELSAKAAMERNVTYDINSMRFDIMLGVIFRPAD